MNRLSLYAPVSAERVQLKIGHSGSGRAVWLSADEAVKLGHRLMSLGSGGGTGRVELFPPCQN